MKYILALSLLLLGLGRSATAQYYEDSLEYGQMNGYTTIDFDPDTNQVTAYSETDIDPSLEIYYIPSDSLDVTDQNNSLVAPPGCQESYNGTTDSWSCQFAAAGGSTYTALGEQSLILQEEYTDPYCDPLNAFGPGYCGYIDQLSFGQLIPFDLADIGYISLFGPGGASVIDNDFLPLATTTDSATITIPVCGDVRDLMIKEYAQMSAYKITSCWDFVDPGTWNYYYMYLSHSYFDFYGLTPDESTGWGQFAILQPYAYVDGLNAIGNQVAAQSAPYGITSGYRNPAAEYSAAAQNGVKPAINSRHMAGDGADLRTNWNGVSNFAQMYDAAAAANSGACFEPPDKESRSHVHIDWRSKTGPVNNWGGTSDFPNPTAWGPNGCPAGWDYY